MVKLILFVIIAVQQIMGLVVEEKFASITETRLIN